MNISDHWDKIYSSHEVEELAWYEDVSSPSLRLISLCNLLPDDPIIDVGAGATTLINSMLEIGFRNLLALDHSSVALGKLRESLTNQQCQFIRFIHADVTDFDWVEHVGEVALWHDRALLHFLDDGDEQRAYHLALNSLVGIGGYVILGTFSLESPSMCSGLPVKRYDQTMLREYLGEDYKLQEAFDFLYAMPSGDLRPYTYALYKRWR